MQQVTEFLHAAGHRVSACSRSQLVSIGGPTFLVVCIRYENTERRKAKVEGKGLMYMGMGVSGGEEGARRGESPCVCVGAEGLIRVYLKS